MSDKVFKKDLPKACKYCVYGTISAFNDEIFCKKRGVTELRDFCRSYKYDPIKRAPERQKIADDYKPEDFLI